MMSLEFSNYINLPTALWPWDRLSLLQKWALGIFPLELRQPVRRAHKLTTLMPIVLKSGSLKLLPSSGLTQACIWIALPLASILETFRPSAPWLGAMSWWQGPTYHEASLYSNAITAHCCNSADTVYAGDNISLFWCFADRASQYIYLRN